MFWTVFFYVFMVIGLINILHFAMYLTGANYYDVKRFKREQERKKRLRSAPRVSVLIPAHNEEKSIIRCIESVRKSSIRDLEIVIIDDASTDGTYDLVNNYIRKNQDFSRSIRLLRCVKNVGKAGALNYALNRGLDGEFVMTLDADSILHPKAIENAIEYFRDSRVVGVAANVQVVETSKFLGRLQKFEYMVGYRSKKFFTVSNSEFIIGGVGSTYRYSVLKQVGFYDDDIQTEDIALSLKIASLGNRNYRLVYGSDVLAMTEGVQTLKALMRQRYRWKLGSLQSLFKHKRLFLNPRKEYSRTLTLYRIPMAFLGELIALLEPVLIVFVIYLSFQALSFTAFISAYSVITLYLLWNLWPDEHLKLSQKLTMTAQAPIMYFLFYVMNFVQFTAIIRCLFNPKQVLRLKPTSSVWTSPERAGQQQVTFS